MKRLSGDEVGLRRYVFPTPDDGAVCAASAWNVVIRSITHRVSVANQILPRHDRQQRAARAKGFARATDEARRAPNEARWAKEEEARQAES